MNDIRSPWNRWHGRVRNVSDGESFPAHHEQCFGCGPENPHGHQLKVRRNGDGIVAAHVFDRRHVGAPGIAHGGAVAAVFDDFFGFLPYLVGQPAVTRSLTVQYLAPVRLGEQYELSARVLSITGRRIEVDASMEDHVGNAAATADAVFVMVDLGHFERHRGRVET
ncbi:PaaI family thioesterase [Cumulibacter manganitolerans]|uniref:PaaI family thioesterase n=1 Tax=Cumulibacter manganitolerans TaxID=1884992 RepID=UPI001E64F1A2|nr:PaaI family thioesterase [Cumulibacter manganitolerans]